MPSGKIVGRLVIRSLCALALAPAVGCQPHARSLEPEPEMPATTRPADAPFTISPLRVQAIGPMSYCYVPVRTSFQELPQTSLRVVAAVRKAAAGRLSFTGPCLFVYHDPGEDPAQPFDMEIGHPVADNAAAPAGLSVRNLPAFRCATVTYRGPMRHLDEAYAKLIPEIIAAGYIPSDETRESYTTWAGPDSAGNVVQIEVGIR
jgi:effector-binding domain-containing protein